MNIKIFWRYLIEMGAMILITILIILEFRSFYHHTGLPSKSLPPSQPHVPRETIFQHSQPGEYIEEIRIMGTYAKVQFYHIDPHQNEIAANLVWEQFQKVDQVCNLYREDSELSQMEKVAAQKPWKCSPLLWELIQWSDVAYRDSQGLFDVTIAPLVQRWGIYRKQLDHLPTQAEIQEIQKRIGWEKIFFDPNFQTVFFKNSEVKLDFGGIAKGFALDLARRALEAHNIRQGLIDLGGNILVLSLPPPSRSSYVLGIRNPLDSKSPRPIATFSLLNGAVATSGNYERFVTIHGKRYGHIINPQTGFPVEGILSASVVVREGVVSDYLSTTIYLSLGQTLHELQKKYPELHALLIFGESPDQVKVRYFPSDDRDFWDFSLLPTSWECKPYTPGEFTTHYP